MSSRSVRFLSLPPGAAGGAGSGGRADAEARARDLVWGGWRYRGRGAGEHGHVGSVAGYRYRAAVR